MKEYKLDFYESYARTEYIQAESLEDALEMAKDMWRSGSVEITNNDFVDVVIASTDPDTDKTTDVILY